MTATDTGKAMGVAGHWLKTTDVARWALHADFERSLVFALDGGVWGHQARNYKIRSRQQLEQRR